MVTIKRLLLMLACVISCVIYGLGAPLHAADVMVTVQPDPPSLEESFRIVFSADEALDGEPNFEPLKGLFEILGQNQSTQVQWVNGAHSKTTSWDLEVVALNSGDVVIPAISFGDDASAPTRVTILSPNSGMTSPKSDLLLEIDVDDNTPYVQQQVLLTVRLLRRLTLADAKLSEPETSSDVIVKVLSKDRTYQDDRLGKRYEVFERRFAIFPQSSGSMRIAPFTVTAQIPRSSRSLFDPFRSSTTTRRISSNEITLAVKPVPAEFTGTTWLPARKLSLREEWEPNGSSIKSGEPLTRTLFLWSEGLTAGQLPDFPTIDFGAANIYPDQIQSNEQETADGFSALKQQKFAIIANASDLIEVPEIAIPWWNVETDQMEIARTTARTISVAASQLQANTANEPTPESLIDSSPGTASEFTNAPAINEPSLDNSVGNWRALAVLAFVGWFLTALAWGLVVSRKRTRTARPATVPSLNVGISRLEKEVARAADANDPFTCRKALLDWGRSVFEGEQLLSLGALEKRVPNALASEIKKLDAHLYAQNNMSWTGENLKIAFVNNKIATPSVVKQADNENLESLFKLN